MFASKKQVTYCGSFASHIPLRCVVEKFMLQKLMSTCWQNQISSQFSRTSELNRLFSINSYSMSWIEAILDCKNQN